MKTLASLFICALLVAVAGCQTAPRAASDADPATDFTAYRSFAVTPIALDAEISDPPIGPTMMAKLERAVREHLIANGYKETALATADLVVQINGQITNRTETQDWGYDHSTRFGNYRGLDRLNVEIGNRGTLIVDIIRREDSKLLWRGWSSRDINGYRTEDEALAKAIDAILATFPPKK
ncbi:MAG: DUF4136 domain-containing protein [Verrucomicrobiota bacterium]|nr:DUF4136 domain-containing protein [Verrucomicrobiota bacterium]